ncbi:hypothetical protein FIBSPDRAFT_914631 [Athelia psychrophila]|uniref:Cytochrome b5 heme-binding domain-containing protein n=1 Tax=Athelia psychrophila TaxID=1759441 RepID=A0A167X306_9AGAM|nr:hypothetical protein FIBSPDRAFT_914631 [Fibularhizoctonia sp. CBS 109695]
MKGSLLRGHLAEALGSAYIRRSHHPASAPLHKFLCPAPQETASVTIYVGSGAPFKVMIITNTHPDDRSVIAKCKTPSHTRFFGLVGLSTAHALRKRALLHKLRFMGGNSTKMSSRINSAGTQTQQAGSMPDDAQTVFDGTKKSGHELACDEIIRALTVYSSDAVSWLQDVFHLDLSQIERLSWHSRPRTHRGDPQLPGMVITYAQKEHLENFATRKKARVTGLYEVASRKGTSKEVAYDSKHWPGYYNLPTTNGDHCTGDGTRYLTMLAGASAIDMEKVQVHPTGLVHPHQPDAKFKVPAAGALRGVGGLLLDNTGARFVDELEQRDYVTGKMWENGKEIKWHCKHYVGRGPMKRFKSGAALAKDTGLDPRSSLRQTFSKTKKNPFSRKVFAEGEWSVNDFFNAVVMPPPVLHYTMGGLEIEAESRVLSATQQPIPGLFAAGGGGAAACTARTVLAGRVYWAGDSAAAYLLQATNNAVTKAGRRLAGVATHVAPTTSAPSAPAPAKAAAPAPAAADGGIVVSGQVLDVTSFLPDHPGGEKAGILYAG